jgi:hypothetical protein
VLLCGAADTPVVATDVATAIAGPLLRTTVDAATGAGAAVTASFDERGDAGIVWTTDVVAVTGDVASAVGTAMAVVRVALRVVATVGRGSWAGCTAV